MAKQLKNSQAPTHEEIAACARRIYEMEGCPEGRALEHWLQAEAQLTAERKAQAAETEPKSAPKPRATKPRVSKRSNSTLPISTRSRASL